MGKNSEPTMVTLSFPADDFPVMRADSVVVELTPDNEVAMLLCGSDGGIVIKMDIGSAMEAYMYLGAALERFTKEIGDVAGND